MKVRTIVCRDCRSIYDCVVAVRTEAAARLRCEFGNLPEEVAPSLQTVLGRLPLSSGEGHQWRVFDPVCPVDPTHRVAPWPSPGRCPRCKAYMESAAVPYRHWD